GAMTDPDLRPRRWNGQSRDASQSVSVTYRFPLAIAVAEGLAGAQPGHAGLVIRHVAQPGLTGGVARIGVETGSGSGRAHRPSIPAPPSRTCEAGALAALSFNRAVEIKSESAPASAAQPSLADHSSALPPAAPRVRRAP